MKKRRTGNGLAKHTQQKKSQNEEHDPNVKDNLEEISWNNHPRRKNKHCFCAGEL